MHPAPRASSEATPRPHILHGRRWCNHNVTVSGCPGWQYLLLSWIPKYLTHLGLTLDKGGVLYALPFICAGLLDNAAAWIADELLLQRFQFSLRATRKTMQAVITMLAPYIAAT